MKPKTAVLVGTKPEILALLKELAPGYPNLRWHDGETLDDPKALDGYEQNQTLLLELAADRPLVILLVHGIARATLARNTSGARAEFVRVYGQPKPRAVRIDRNWLRKNGACADGTAWFVDTFGKTASVASDAVMELLPKDKPSWKSWLRTELLSNPAD